MIGRHLRYTCSGTGDNVVIRISGHKFEGDSHVDSHSKDAGDGRVLTLACKCGSNDWSDNGRFINEYECICCGQYVAAYEYREKTKGKS